MKRTTLPLLAVGCGIFEGSESRIEPVPCEVLATAEVTDLHGAVFDLEPVGPRLDAVIGAFAVHAWASREHAPPGPWPGVITLRRDGPIVAEQRESPPFDDGWSPLRCASRYRVPVRVDVELDDGVLAWRDVPLEAGFIDEIDYAEVWDGVGGWQDATTVTGSLDLRNNEESPSPDRISLIVFAGTDGLHAIVGGGGDVVHGPFTSRGSWSILDLCTDCAESPPSGSPMLHQFVFP